MNKLIECPFRRPILSDADSGSDANSQPEGKPFFCGLVLEIINHDQQAALATQHDCEVSAEACVACARTFKPTINDPNPVVASLTYGTVETLKQSSEPGTESYSQLEQIQEFADRNLPRVLPHESDVDSVGFRNATVAIDIDELIKRLPLPGPVPGGERAASLDDTTTWAVGMTTAHRRQSTVQLTLDGFSRCGWSGLHLFVDGDSLNISLPASCSTTVRSEPAGAWHNFLLSLTEMVDRQPSADAYLLLQDDIAWPNAPELRLYLENLLWPNEDDLCILSLYTSVDDCKESAGWHKYDGSWKFGALGLIFSKRVARMAVVDSWLRSYSWNNDAGVAGIDAILGQWAVRNGITFWHPVPSIIQHTGHVSAIWESARAVGLRRASNWLGEEKPM